MSLFTASLLMLVGPNEKWGYEHWTPAMSGKRAQAVDTTKYSPPPASPKIFVITHVGGARGTRMLYSNRASMLFAFNAVALGMMFGHHDEAVSAAYFTCEKGRLIDHDITAHDVLICLSVLGVSKSGSEIPLAPRHRRTTGLLPGINQIRIVFVAAI
jgi:hypothetical protein